MALHHRHKQRLLGTIVTLIAILLCLDVYLILSQYVSLELSLLLTFGVGILLLSLYHLYNYRHCHEHVTMINNLTQTYFGVVLLFSIILILLLRAVFLIEIVNAYIIMSVLVILLVFLTLGPYDRFLEEHLAVRFPTAVPQPRRTEPKAKKK